VPWHQTADGFVTLEVLEWYARFAEGQPGVLVVEATGIRDAPSGPRSGSATIASGPGSVASATSGASGARAERGS
jgi:hypothetical protein